MSTERIVELEQRLAEMTTAYQSATAEHTRLQARYDDLSAKYDTLKRRFFGRSSEKQQQDDQPQLFDEPADEQTEDENSSDETATVVRSHTRKKHSRKPLPVFRATIKSSKVQSGIPRFCKTEFPGIAKAIVRPRVGRLPLVEVPPTNKGGTTKDAYNGSTTSYPIGVFSRREVDH